MTSATQGDMAQATAEDQGSDEPEEVVPTVLLLGTAHVVPLRKAIQHHIFEFQPDAVALELDRARLQGLLAPPEDRQKGGMAYGFIARFQQKVADDLGGSVGDEMLAGREAAMLLGVPVALVDAPAQETFRRLIQEMGWGERFKLIGSVLGSILPGNSVEADLQRALEGDPSLIEEVSRRFPTVKRVLIDERDELMARRVGALARDRGRVVAIVGDAHVPGMVARLEGQVERVHAVRVKQLQAGIPNQASFSVELGKDGA
ncbi:MAG: TraB/GumN family protein [Candidatus Thermoplasmatota archaeon]|nr:TraB/GumN family protein [Candidatus Thermoplasmatota archaeon]